MSKPGFWTERRCKTLRNLYADGMQDGTLARHFGRTKRAIAIQRSRLGLVVRTIERKESVRDYHTYTLLCEVRRRGKMPTTRTLASYTTGTLIAQLGQRGYSVKITRKLPC